MKNPLILAYYLPQFHPIKENDLWWGKGFTEWTNVGKAKPLFKGHYQPKVPSDLGYYDLRVREVRESQADLAREAGVNGFCYWHYWFSKDFQLMNEIIDDVAETGRPDFPFCLGWANESWKAKQWNKDGRGDKILAEQRYDGVDDYRAHFDYVKKLFQNKNYVRVDGNPFFLIYKPFDSPKVADLMKMWNQWIKEEGIAEKIFFVASLDKEAYKKSCLEMGFSAVVPAHLQRVQWSFDHSPRWLRGIRRFVRKFYITPMKFKMSSVNKHIPNINFDKSEDVIPFLLPQWDHTARSGVKGYLTTGSTPEQFKHQAKRVLELVAKKKNKIIMLKSWNEWAEGNYMEPDLKWGKGFIKALHEAVDSHTK